MAISEAEMPSSSHTRILLLGTLEDKRNIKKKIHTICNKKEVWASTDIELLCSREREKKSKHHFHFR